MADIITVKNLTRSFGKFIAVNNISLTVPEGKIFGLLGPNGAGKTTFIRILTATLGPSSGYASVCSYDVTKYPEKVRSHEGYMSQAFTLYKDLTVDENLKFFGSIYGLHGEKQQKRITYLLDQLALEPFRKRLAGELSGGLRQRLALAIALIHDPPLLILDEPTAGVDPHLRKNLWAMFNKLKNLGKTFLISTHYMDEARYCDILALMYHGMIIYIGTEYEIKSAYASKNHLSQDAINTINFEDAFIGLTTQKTIDV